MEKYKITIDDKVNKDIQKIPKKDLEKVFEKIHSLSHNPRPFGAERLTNDEKYRIRQGNYRVLYFIKDKIVTIEVVKIQHRKQVYR